MSRSSSTATRWPRRRTYFDFGGTRHSPDHRLEAWSADLRGSEYFTIRVRELADRRGSARHHRADQRQRRLGPRFDVLLLRPARRQSSAIAGLPPSAGHGAERRRAGLRGEGQRLVHARRGKRERPLLHRRHRQPGDLRALADRSRRCRRHAAPGGGARDRRALQRLRSRRRALHPHQPGRRDRFPHRHRAAGHAGPRATGAS